MNPTDTTATDPLLEIELRIAHRADELDKRFGIDRADALEHWRAAEREVWFGEMSAASHEKSSARR
jgi:hypothetical protein